MNSNIRSHHRLVIRLPGRIGWDALLGAMQEPAVANVIRRLSIYPLAASLHHKCVLTMIVLPNLKSVTILYGLLLVAR